MILSDTTIKELVRSGKIIIKPFDERLIGPSSIDLRLGNEFLIFQRSKLAYIDPKNPIDDFIELVKIKEGEAFIIHPNEFVLATTLEYIKLPEDIAARIEGRSSIARLGLIVHSTGGFVDAGFEGQLTLEMSNINRVPIKIYPGMRIAQLAFIKQDRPSEIPYWKRNSSKYIGQKGPVASRIHLDFSK